MRLQLGAERLAEPHGTNIASPNGRQQILGSHFESLGEFGDVDLAESQPPVLTIQHHPPLGHVCFMILLFEPATDLRSRRGRFQISEVGIQPIAAGVAVPRRQDLDLLVPAFEDLLPGRA